MINDKNLQFMIYICCFILLVLNYYRNANSYTSNPELDWTLFLMVGLLDELVKYENQMLFWVCGLLGIFLMYFLWSVRRLRWMPGWEIRPDGCEVTFSLSLWLWHIFPTQTHMILCLGVYESDMKKCGTCSNICLWEIRWGLRTSASATYLTESFPDELVPSGSPDLKVLPRCVCVCVCDHQCLMLLFG